MALRRKGEFACFKGVQDSEFPRRPGLTAARICGKFFIKRAGYRAGKGREQTGVSAPAEVVKRRASPYALGDSKLSQGGWLPHAPGWTVRVPALHRLMEWIQ